jgi:UDP-N-acetylmuramoyl-L-alanyl-D-glutamate--2,6-diaminopimelate ligase
MKVEKFPFLKFQGKQLQWDLRQKVLNPLVVLRRDINSEVLKELKNLASHILEEGKDFKSWGSFVSSLYGEPSQKLKVLGMTGTNGKTTTAALLRFLLVKNGKKVLELGTLGAQLWNPFDNTKPLWREETGFTSPEAHTLQSLMFQAVEQGVDAFVMEVTSHSIALQRIAGVEFDGAAFLNFSQDHLDFHKTLEEYKKVKKSFFTDFLAQQKNKKAALFINRNDPVGKELERELSPPFRVFENGKDYFIDESSMELRIVFEKQTYELPMIGSFQAENVFAACLLASHITNFGVSQLLRELREFPGVPGRMEILNLKFKNESRKLIVDFAHTPDALEKNLLTLKNAQKKGKLWVLFGCGGDRDPFKRPQMGMIAARLADVVVVTSDNARSENPDTIIDQIVEPLVRFKQEFTRFTDRKKAMKYCLETMNPEDVCLVAGRGHEEYQLIGAEKIPFKDSEVLKSLCC